MNLVKELKQKKRIIVFLALFLFYGKIVQAQPCIPTGQVDIFVGVDFNYRDLLNNGRVYEERHPKRYKRNGDGGINWNKAILWAIPIFWPILIAKMFLSGKTYKPTMNEYDYEQFLKGNGK